MKVEKGDDRETEFSRQLCSPWQSSCSVSSCWWSSRKENTMFGKWGRDLPTKQQWRGKKNKKRSLIPSHIRWGSKLSQNFWKSPPSPKLLLVFFFHKLIILWYLHLSLISFSFFFFLFLYRFGYLFSFIFYRSSGRVVKENILFEFIIFFFFRGLFDEVTMPTFWDQCNNALLSQGQNFGPKRSNTTSHNYGWHHHDTFRK